MNTKYTISLLLALTTMQAAGAVFATSEENVRKHRLIDQNKRISAIALDKLLRLENRGKDYKGVEILDPADFEIATGLAAADPIFRNNQTVNRISDALDDLRSDNAMKALMGSGTSVSLAHLNDLLGNLPNATTPDNLEDILTNMSMSNDAGDAMVLPPSNKLGALTAAISSGKGSIYDIGEVLEKLIDAKGLIAKLNTTGEVNITGLQNSQGNQAANQKVGRKNLISVLSQTVDTFINDFRKEIEENMDLNTPQILKAVQLQEIFGQIKGIATTPAGVVAAIVTPGAGGASVGTAATDRLIATYKACKNGPLSAGNVDAFVRAVSNGVAVAAMPGDFANGALLADANGVMVNGGNFVPAAAGALTLFKSMFSGGYLKPLTAKIEDFVKSTDKTKLQKQKFQQDQLGIYTADDSNAKMLNLKESDNIAKIRSSIRLIFQDFNKKNTETPEQRADAEAKVAQIIKYLEDAESKAKGTGDGKAKLFSAKGVSLSQIQIVKKEFDDRNNEFKKNMADWYPSEAAKKDSDIQKLTTEAKTISEDKVADFFEKIKNLSADGQKQVVDAAPKEVKEKLNKMIEDKAAADKLAEETAATKEKAEEKAKEEAERKALAFETLKVKVAKSETATQPNEIAFIVAQLKTITEAEKKQVLEGADPAVKKAVEDAITAEAAKAAAEKAAAEAAKKPAAPSKRKAAARRQRGNARKGQKARGRAVKGKNPRKTKKITKRSNRKTAENDSKDSKSKKA